MTDSIDVYEDDVTEATAVIDNGSFGTRTIRFETGRLAQQAAGAVDLLVQDVIRLDAFRQVGLDVFALLAVRFGEEDYLRHLAQQMQGTSPNKICFCNPGTRQYVFLSCVTKGISIRTTYGQFQGLMV